MGIQSGHIGTQSIATETTVVLEMLTTRPVYGLAFQDGLLRTPGQIVGFFNGTTGTVELYCVDNTGRKALKVG